jgi:glycosyltransferase involved in cell wall biosynthesis
VTRRLLLLTPAELTRDPRARRQAHAALRRGWTVVGLCGQFPADEPAELEGVDVRRLPHRGRGSTFRRAAAGLTAGSDASAPSPFARELRGAYQLLRLWRQTRRLSGAARSLERVDIVHANDLDTLPAATMIARRHRARLVYDAHELYTAVEPDPPRLHRLVIGLVERTLARRADAVVTVSEPIADELVRRLGLRRSPVVVLNCPERWEGPVAGAPTGRLRAIYQAGANPARPLEDVLAAASDVEDVELTLRVAGIDDQSLRDEVARRGLADRVHVAPTVQPDRLVEALAPFHVGLVIDRPVSRNNELGFPNKLFEYLMAGLAVAVPRLPTMQAFVEREQVGVSFEPGRPGELAAALNTLASDRPLLERLRRRSRELALERYNAEAQSTALDEAWGVQGTTDS